MTCYFCNSDDITEVYEGFGGKLLSYYCPRCGSLSFTEEAVLVIEGGKFNEEEKKKISIVTRNEYERSGQKLLLTTDYLDQILERYRPLGALEKIDNALLNLDRISEGVGYPMQIDYQDDFPYYHCNRPRELKNILSFLCEGGFINVRDRLNPHEDLYIATKGYEKLKDLKKLGKDSQQCFVAMSLAPEMNNVFELAIKPGIEYIEEGENESRFRALRIDNKEHTNDINDEIIAEIRRSRFMVCDLTGYRGGVYWEAGFAYGLGLEVIYTCRKDWIKAEPLKDTKGKVINKLLDSNGNKIEIKKDGIHFDLEHRNRIDWKEIDLEGFEDKLKKRIKAVII